MCQNQYGTAMLSGDAEPSPLYCFNTSNENECSTGDCDPKNVLFDPPNVCTCGLPGPRHGFKMLNFLVEGQLPTVLMYGGETTNLDVSKKGQYAFLTSDVHVISFGPAQATSLKIFANCPPKYSLYKNLAGGKDPTKWCGLSEDGFSDSKTCCPVPRRDSSSAMFGNSATSNGKLIIYGGMACPSTGCEAASPVKQFLAESASPYAPISLNDLWYLDMSSIDSTCVKEGACSYETYASMMWVQVEVPGTKPASRWGAGLMIDTLDQLYLTVSRPVPSSPRFPPHALSPPSSP